MSYKIEKNISIPPRGIKVLKREWNYPLLKMAIGDSFLTKELYSNASRTKITQRCKILLKQMIEESSSKEEKKQLSQRKYWAGIDPKKKLPDGSTDPESGKYVRVWRKN